MFALFNQALVVVSLVATGTAAGVLFGVALANVPALLALSPQRYVETHRLLDRFYEPTMPLLVLVGGLADLVLALTEPDWLPRALHLSAVAALAGVASISWWVNRPLLASIREVPDDGTLPDDWSDPRPRWNHWHRERTALALVALTLTAVATAIA